VPLRLCGKIIDKHGQSRYFVIMAEDTDNKSPGNKAKILAGFLTEALDLEDKVSISVYKDYMDAKNWPKNLKPEIFQNIKQYLNVLIEDTQKHRKIILGLMQNYGQDKRPE
jgi:hypothetical protein